VCRIINESTQLEIYCGIVLILKDLGETESVHSAEMKHCFGCHNVLIYQQTTFLYSNTYRIAKKI